MANDQVCEIDCSKPIEEQATYRPMTDAEQAERDERAAAELEQSTRNAWLELRKARDRMLAATDYQTDVPWQKWRQQLRDLPGNTDNPETPKWPKPPRVVSTLVEFRGLWPKLDWSQLERGS